MHTRSNAAKSRKQGPEGLVAGKQKLSGDGNGFTVHWVTVQAAVGSDQQRTDSVQYPHCNTLSAINTHGLFRISTFQNFLQVLRGEALRGF